MSARLDHCLRTVYILPSSPICTTLHNTPPDVLGHKVDNYTPTDKIPEGRPKMLEEEMCAEPVLTTVQMYTVVLLQFTIGKGVFFH